MAIPTTNLQYPNKANSYHLKLFEIIPSDSAGCVFQLVSCLLLVKKARDKIPVLFGWGSPEAKSVAI